MSATLIQFFETMAARTIAQGEPSQDQFGECRYRGPNGLRCAVGQMLRRYDEDWEGCAPDTLVARGAFGEVTERLTERGLEWFLRKLSVFQTIHDQDDPGDWPEIYAEALVSVRATNFQGMLKEAA